MDACSLLLVLTSRPGPVRKAGAAELSGLQILAWLPSACSALLLLLYQNVFLGEKRWLKGWNPGQELGTMLSLPSLLSTPPTTVFCYCCCCKCCQISSSSAQWSCLQLFPIELPVNKVFHLIASLNNHGILGLFGSDFYPVLNFRLNIV